MADGETCATPFGTFELLRNLPDRTGTLRAWDGADLLALDHLVALQPAPGRRVAIVGDIFGALTVAATAAGLDPLVWNDSMASHHAIGANLARNGLAPVAHEVRLGGKRAAMASVDTVVWKVDRSTDLVAAVLNALIPICDADTVVLAAGMDKHLPPRTAAVLRDAGDVITHRGRYKAHAFELRPSSSVLTAVAEPSNTTVAVAEHDLVLRGAPGVFSADRLDLGTRLLMGQIAEHLPRHDFGVADVPTVVDLGCGNGALGITALRVRPDATVCFIDDSARAVDCARRNVADNVGDDGLARSTFVHSDVYADVDDTIPPLVDLVLCNPPFHQSGTVTDEVARQMFVGSRDRLAEGGELWLVANRHLGYHAVLRRLFGSVGELGSHPKYVLLRARGRR